MPSPLAQLGAGNAVRRRPRLALPGILAGATTHADAAALATAAIPIFLSRGAVPSLYKVRRKPLSRRGGVLQHFHVCRPARRCHVAMLAWLPMQSHACHLMLLVDITAS